MNSVKKREKKQINQWLKSFGSVLMIFALLFIVKRVLEMDIDYKGIFNIRTVLFSLLISVLYGIMIIIYCWPWRNYIEMITGERLPLRETAYVMAKSNLLKYVPGNVFQYIGRNEIAVEKGLRHSEVGMATVLEIVTNFSAALFLGCVFYFDGFWKVVLRFKQELILIAGAGALILLTVIFAVWYKKKTLLQKYLDIFRNKENRKTILKNLLFFALNALVNAGLYIVTLILVLNMSFDAQEIYILSGAYILAWIIGFVIPGAPGGIGIRELVMTLLIPREMDMQMILLGLVLYRFINIAGDAAGVLFAAVLRKEGGKKIT